MVAVTALEIRERVNLSESDISDAVVIRFAVAAAVTVSLELGKPVDYADCSVEEAEAIRNLAAVYCACKVSGGSACGLSFRLGDLSVNESATAGDLEFLVSEAYRIIDGLKAPYVGSV
jgi:hypothetical protein